MHFHTELVIQPYRSGIRLAQPEQACGSQLCDLYQSSISTYFMSADSRCLHVNDGAAMLCGADSAHDLIGRDALSMWDRKSADKMMLNDKQVMHGNKIHVTDDSAIRSWDDSYVQMITFKMPWFQAEKVSGVFGLTLKLDLRSLTDFTHNLQLVTATGLLRGQSLSALQQLNQIQGKSYFTKREQEVLALLLKGCTARQIADKLVLSKRTIEHHIENIKLKANCRNKYELFEKYSGHAR